MVGDQHCAAIIQQEFLKLGICYRVLNFGAGTRLDLFGNLKYLLYQMKIQILDQPELLRQLRALEAHKTVRGNIDIRSAYDVKDDLAVAVALAAFQLSNMDVEPLPAFTMSRVERPWDVRMAHSEYEPWTFERTRSLNLTPGACYLEAICGNFPDCMDAGHCLGFKDERRSTSSVKI